MGLVEAATGAAAPAFAAGFVLLFVVFGALAVASLVLFIVALIDMLRRPDWQWKLAGQEKILWVVLILLVNAFGIVSLIYWFSIRKKLMAVEQAAASGQYGPGYMTPGGWVPGPFVPPPPAMPAGWYPDPSGQGGMRWWDGREWTPHVQPGAPAAGGG